MNAVRRSYIYIIRVSKWRRERMGQKIFEVIMAENFLKWLKIANHVFGKS